MFLCVRSVSLLFVVMVLSSCGGAQSPDKATTDRASKWKKGLRVEVIKEGAGARPVMPHRVTVHYTGYLAEKDGSQGKKFDSSLDRKQPFTFRIGLGEVITGWDQGIQEMRVGGTYRLFIPAALGYGDFGSGSIPPRADLIFEITVLSVS